MEVLNVTFFNQISFRNSDRAGYSDLNPVDGGQSLYPMGTVLAIYDDNSCRTNLSISLAIFLASFFLEMGATASLLLSLALSLDGAVVADEEAAGFSPAADPGAGR